MKGIEVAFLATVITDAVSRVTKTGRAFFTLRAVVDAGLEEEEQVSIAAFSLDTIAMTPLLTKHTEIYVEGKLRLKSWQDDTGAIHPRLTITASKIEPLGIIGQKRPKKKTTSRAKLPAAPAFNDPLPF